MLTNECRCHLAERFCIAEREGVHCRSESSQQRCLKWLELLREQARFALRTDEERRLLPHGKAIRLQVGGMRGLVKVLSPDAAGEPATTIDVDSALADAETRYAGLDNVPFSDVMRDVAAYQVESGHAGGAERHWLSNCSTDKHQHLHRLMMQTGRFEASDWSDSRAARHGSD